MLLENSNPRLGICFYGRKKLEIYGFIRSYVWNIIQSEYDGWLEICCDPSFTKKKMPIFEEDLERWQKQTRRHFGGQKVDMAFVREWAKQWQEEEQDEDDDNC